MADPTGSEEPERQDRLGPGSLIREVWAEEGGLFPRLLGAILTPAELGFRAVVGARATAYRAGIANIDAPPVPTISVGNITVGGTGKTPFVRWLVRWLVHQGFTPGILHGGYAEDEPELHHLWFPSLPVIADQERLRGADAALQEGADVLVLDDAFQHRAIGRDLDVVLVAAETWTRYGRVLPRGPYREPPRALRRADLVVVTRRSAGPGEAARAEAEVARISGRPTARVHLRPAGWLNLRLQARAGAPDGPAIAVAGVARPDDFFDQIEGLGVVVKEAIGFPDHYDYTADEARALADEAAGGPLVTTAKDAVKLGVLVPEADLWVLEQEVFFESGREVVVDAVDGVVA